MARTSAPADRTKASRSRGPLGSALSAAMLSLAALGAGSGSALADGPAPGNGAAIFRDVHLDATGHYLDVNGNPVPVDANGNPLDPATGQLLPPPAEFAAAQAPQATPPADPAAAAPAPTAPGTPDGDSSGPIGAVEPIPTKKPHRSTPTSTGDRRKHRHHRHDEHNPHPAPPTPDTEVPNGPQPAVATAPPTKPVPDIVLKRFNIPPFLLPVYQAAAVSYNVPWTVLAAINSVETDYGRNTNVSSAGALGWMQFMPATWRMYGVDANLDGKRDPYNPADAIFAAARYLDAAGADKDIRRA